LLRETGCPLSRRVDSVSPDEKVEDRMNPVILRRSLWHNVEDEPWPEGDCTYNARNGEATRVF
jgi:hypothetical protein